MSITANMVAYELWRRYENRRSSGQIIPDLDALMAEIDVFYPALSLSVREKGIEAFLNGVLNQSVQRWIIHRQWGQSLFRRMATHSAPIDENARWDQERTESRRRTTPTVSETRLRASQENRL